jgi:hypothetical protein
MTATPVTRILEAVVARGLRFKESRGEITAQCPAHEDQHPSLSVSEGEDGRALLFCHAGCAFEDVLSALGLEATDAFPGRTPVARRKTRSNPASEVDAKRLWDQMALRDHAGEGHISARGLLVEPFPSAVVRFNQGGTGNPFVDGAARKGFRIAFAVRDVAGLVATISFRHVGAGAEWGGTVKTKLALKGRPTKGVAITRPEISLLFLDDPEFARDEVVLCEGGTDWLAATIANDVAAIENEVPPTWVLGCVGAANAISVVKAFAPVIAGRVLHLWFDSDEAGRNAAEAAAAIAVDIGARVVRRYRPADKDVARDLQAAVQP